MACGHPLQLPLHGRNELQSLIRELRGRLKFKAIIRNQNEEFKAGV
jgi:hypothetical protein